MRGFIVIATLLVGTSILFQRRFKILNALLAINTIRKVIVTISMNMPFIRSKILPSILGRSAL
ncbi:hypothetical protein [Sediminibacillus massiliensis]|uniref:hypothetical protein n=1 Tax=Sediminibacillus massiliensis TaxID=1926277 RepID=UPI0009884946|nr:hypothetical protein [Sediminibacillus massiliensis]